MANLSANMEFTGNFCANCYRIFISTVERRIIEDLPLNINYVFRKSFAINIIVIKLIKDSSQ